MERIKRLSFGLVTWKLAILAKIDQGRRVAADKWKPREREKKKNDEEPQEAD